MHFNFASNGDIVINEIYNAGTQNDEYYEIVLTTDYTAAQLESFYFGDSPSTNIDITSSFKFTGLSGIALTFYAGTIITLTGNNFTEDLVYTPNPTVNATDDGAWNIILKETNGTYVDIQTNFGDTSTGLSATATNFAGGGDTFYVSTLLPNNNLDTSGFVTSLAYDNDVATYMYTNAQFQINSTIATGDIIYNTDNGDAVGDYSISTFTLNGTMGTPNGGVNTTWIQNLRNVPEPSSALLILFATQFFLFKRVRRINK